jgi:exodeoxyribonuclease VII small subunit
MTAHSKLKPKTEPGNDFERWRSPTLFHHDLVLDNLITYPPASRPGGKMAKKKAIAKMNYEEAFTELQSIVETLEGAELPLEESLTLFERGQALSTRCGDLLEEAQLRLVELTKDVSGELTETDMDIKG